MQEHIKIRPKKISSTNLNPFVSKSFQNGGLKFFIEMGIWGHFPLFYTDWVTDHLQKFASRERNEFSKKDIRKVTEIINKLDKHKSVDRKRTILMAIPENERELFINAFFCMIENKIIDEGPALH